MNPPLSKIGSQINVAISKSCFNISSISPKVLGLMENEIKILG